MLGENRNMVVKDKDGLFVRAEPGIRAQRGSQRHHVGVTAGVVLGSERSCLARIATRMS